MKGFGEVIVLVVLCAVICFGSLTFAYWKCDSKATAMKLPFSYGPIQGCMVETKNGVFPIEAVRSVD